MVSVEIPGFSLLMIVYCRPTFSERPRRESNYPMSWNLANLEEAYFLASVVPDVGLKRTRGWPVSDWLTSNVSILQTRSLSFLEP